MIFSNLNIEPYLKQFKEDGFSLLVKSVTRVFAFRLISNHVEVWNILKPVISHTLSRGPFYSSGFGQCSQRYYLTPACHLQPLNTRSKLISKKGLICLTDSRAILIGENILSN